MPRATGSRSNDAGARGVMRWRALVVSRGVVFGLAACAAMAPAIVSAQERPVQVRIPRDRLEQMVRPATQPERVTVFDTAGLAQRVAIDQVEGLTLQRGQFAVLRTGDATTTTIRRPEAVASDTTMAAEAEGEWNVLPYRYVTPDATGTGLWTLRPIYKVANRLRWQSGEGVFRGDFFIAVEDTLRLRESRPLPAPIRFQLLSDADSLAPHPVAIDHTNFPVERIRVTARLVNDSLRVHVIPEFDVRGVDVWIPVAPALVIETSPRTIQGWGIQQARVVVRLIGASTPGATTASLITSAGTLDTLELPIGQAGIGTTWLRSEGIGEAELLAAAPGLGSVRTVIEYTFPWIFLLAALLGGIFGGITAAAMKRKGRRKARWGEFALKGVLAGVLAALAWYALGINLLHLDVGVARFNELAVFTLAALAGYFGVPRSMGGPETA